jgi:xanthine dehydrogenase accessory factor
MKPAILARLLEARAAAKAVALVTDLDGGRQALVGPTEVTGDLDLAPDSIAVVRAQLRAHRSGMLEASAGTARLFVQAFNPPLRLAIVGAVHIAQILAPMAALAGYSVSVIDPRRSFATDQRFPSIELIVAWPDEALAAFQPDHRTAIVTLTHDPKLDDPALDAALRSPAFYIGALGSKRTHAKRIERLTALGFDTEAIGRVHGPIGLPLGGRSPAEIAVSVLGQMVAVLNAKAAAPERAGTP